MTPAERDAFFLSSVNILAEKHGAKIIEIDMEKRILEFDCPDDVPFALELDELFSEYLV